MVVVSFPQKWEIDEHGRLHEKLEAMSTSTPAFLAALAMALFAGFAIRRSRVAPRATLLQPNPFDSDVEMTLE